MKTGGRVLISWIAVNNDPYERERGKATYRLVDGEPVSGPTFTILFDEQSPYNGLISDLVLLHRKTDGPGHGREQRAVEETIKAVRERRGDLRIQVEPWFGDDPTDHQAIFKFLRKIIPNIRKKYAGWELLIHISPGTPSMQTIWVLMAETGFVDPPFNLVKSYRKSERRGRSAVVPVKLGIENFYKVYKVARPRQVAAEDERVVWDPGKFRTTTMQQLFVEARRFAYLNVPVLILGERGTGKTTLAGWIRLHSPFRRKDQDVHWPSVACGQYSPETMRSELFGYKKGSFTGATKDTDGLLSAANGDTLFLDEVGDLSHDLQRLLIKALEEKQYLPLGDDRPKNSDFRLLTATNIDMSELRNRLDPDFLDRISLITLQVPPLRKIPEEIPWLWETVFEQAVIRSGAGSGGTKLTVGHHRQIASQLMKHPLPGNLRDLFRIAYRVIAASTDPHEPLSAQDSVEYGLECLAAEAQKDLSLLSLSRRVTGAFSKSLPLDGLVQQESPLSTKAIERDLKTYLGSELRRIAKIRGSSVEEICDVSERALRTWVKSDRKEASD